MPDNGSHNNDFVDEKERDNGSEENLIYGETQTLVRNEKPAKDDQVLEARMKGYEGDACGECGNFTLVRNGTCLKCNTCGATSGCS
jgi:ribonucleoside-diphosphate reductase alpha chain